MLDCLWLIEYYPSSLILKNYWNLQELHLPNPTAIGAMVGRRPPPLAICQERLYYHERADGNADCGRGRQ